MRSGTRHNGVCRQMAEEIRINQITLKPNIQNEKANETFTIHLIRSHDRPVIQHRDGRRL